MANILLSLLPYSIFISAYTYIRSYLVNSCNKWYILFVYNKLVNFVIIVAGDGDVFFFSIYFNSIEFNFNIIQNMSQLQFLKDLNLVVKWLNYYLSGCLSILLSVCLNDWVTECVNECLYQGFVELEFCIFLFSIKSHCHCSCLNVIFTPFI